MGTILNIATSGLQAAEKKFATASENIVNANSTGSIDTDGKQAYIPQDIVQTSLENGEVKADRRDRDPATQTLYAPSDPNANDDGLVAAPNVVVTEEILRFKEAEQAYKASALLIDTAQNLQDSLTDALNEEA